MTCHCGTEFIPRISRQKHCSRACCTTAATRAWAERNPRPPLPVHRRLCVRMDCRREFRTRNMRKVYCSARCAYYIAWRFRREAERSGFSQAQ